MSALRICALAYLVCASLLHVVIAKGSEAQVTCTPQVMTVVVPMDGDRKISYLEQMKEYSPCAPVLDNGLAIFRLGLEDPHQCGVTRVLNKYTGKQVYYHKVAVETSGGLSETISARCVVIPEVPHAPHKRAVDFPSFQEPENLEITTSYTGHAPDPQLAVAVKQAGKKVSGEISVNPGTPLAMEISLDNSSSSVYGLLVSYMEVTDTKEQQETIIFNGCSVDPYLFDNFLTSDGDTLTAKFRAFKFPDTTYVQFKGTVTVCLDKCQGIPCSNGATGYGRKRRAVRNGAESNKVFEVSLTTFIKVDYLDGNKEADEINALLKNLKIANQMLEDHMVHSGHETKEHSAMVHERTQDRDFEMQRIPESGGTFVGAQSGLVILCVTFLNMLLRLL